MNVYYLKIAIRNAFKNGTLSFAKLFGLIISFTVILFAAGFVYYETSFDKCIPDHDRIYRCLMEGRLNGQDASFAVTSAEMAKAIKLEIPEITEVIRVLDRGEPTVKCNNESYKWGRILYTDPEFFSFFSIPVKTDLANPFASLNNLVIAKSLAIKYFGTTNKALNKSIEINGETCTITGVFDDVPKNFHLQPKLIQSLQKSEPEKSGWYSQNYFTYFKTNTTAITAKELTFKLTKTVYLHSNSDNKAIAAKAKTIKDFIHNPDFYIIYPAEPLIEIHFSKHKFDPAITTSKDYVYGASILSILILLISSINFTNLTIANISTRLKIIGIQKTAGSKNNQIIRQFLFESLIFLITGFVLAIFIYQLAENPLKQYLNFDIGLSTIRLLEITGFTFIALLLFNVISILFPIIFVSNKKILDLTKGDTAVKRGFSINTWFVSFQFFLSGLIILSSVIVQKQVNFMITKDRGYDTQNVMMLEMWRMNPETRRSFIEELKTYPVVKSVSTSDVYFGEDFGMNDAYFETQNLENYFHTSVLPVDDEFLNTFNPKIKEGRFFDKKKQTDFDAVLLNETALKKYSAKGSILGKLLIMNNKPYNIIGIVKDFNFRSLHYPVQPLVIRRIDNFGNVFVKITNQHIPEALKIIKNLWGKYNIGFPLDYKFHDQVVASHYKMDQHAKRLLLLLSIISVIIACVGLYAISSFTIIRRTKEIGIRKVNGARIMEVVTMLSNDFIKWVAISFIIACPVAWYAMHTWLQNFAYKTDLNWWVFAIAGIMAVTVAILTISWQSWRAATRNPVEALRYE